MAEPVLLDQYGRPIQRQMLMQATARANLMGVRSPFHEGASRGLNPRRLANLLREADENNPERYMELAEEIEEKDLHYLSLLGTRKRQVSQLDMSVEAASKDAADVKVSEAVQEHLIDSGVIDAYLFDALDAVGKGFSLGEMIWTTRSDLWTIDHIEHVDPRFVRFDRATMRNAMLLGDNGEHLPLAPFKFLWVEIKAKSGIPIRGGLARAAAWAYMFKNFSLKDWVQFCEIYGIPFRLGKFPPGASEDDKSALLSAVASIAQDAAGIIPMNMDVQFVETKSNATGGDLFKALCDYCDQQMSKATLGQTGTADATPGRLGNANEHTMVREDIERADAKALSVALSRQVVRPFVDLNFGPQERYPWIKLGREETVNAQLMVDAAQKLPQLRIRAGDIRAAVGFTEPQDGDEVIGGQAPQAAPAALPGVRPGVPGAPQANALATAIAAIDSTQDAIDRAADEALAGWAEVMSAPAKQIMEVALASASYDDFKARLIKLYPSIDMSPLANKLAELTFQATVAGYAGDRVGTERKAMAAFNPDEPRIPEGSPLGGQWTNGEGGLIRVLVEPGRAYPIERAFIASNDYLTDPKAEILRGGHIRATVPPGPWGEAERKLVRDALDREFEPPREPGVFWRFTNDRREAEIAGRAELRNSYNHADNFQEQGLSVADGPHYAVAGYKYGYRVSGRRVGTGSDGEPLLDPKSIKVLSKPQSVEKIVAEDGRKAAAYRKDRMAALDWTEEQYRAATKAFAGFQPLGSDEFRARFTVKK